MTVVHRLYTTCLLILALACFMTAAQPFVIQSGERAGIDFVNICGDPEIEYILDANGNGCALVDLDRDGLLDVVLVGGSTIEHLQKSGGDQVIAI